MNDKLEFGSAEWFELLRQQLEEAITPLGSSIAGVTFSICEVVTDPPTHLTPEGEDRIGWWFRIDGPTVDAGFGIRDDMEHRSEGKYSTVLEHAKAVYRDDPAALDATRRRQTAAADAGRVQRLEVPPELAGALIEVHDAMARATR